MLRNLFASYHLATCNLRRKEYNKTRGVPTSCFSSKVNPSWQVLNSNPAATCCSWSTIRWAPSPVLNGVITSYGFVKWVTEAITPVSYEWSSNPTYNWYTAHLEGNKLGRNSGCSFAHPQYANTHLPSEFSHLFPPWPCLFHHHLSRHGLTIWTPEPVGIVTWRWNLPEQLEDHPS